MRAHYYLVQATMKVERRLYIHSFHRSIHCQRNSMRGIPFISNLLQMPKFVPNIGRARNWPTGPPAALYECSYEQWARIFSRVMTRPTRPVPLLRAKEGLVTNVGILGCTDSAVVGKLRNKT